MPAIFWNREGMHNIARSDLDDILPGAKIIGVGVEVPDMKRI
jgi:hypothetical protein